ncbi:MAG: gamma-glutamyl-gamma-aminobutyrate hydrolase family protein [Chloroflexota bacterium]|jgi:putative glutamine amidotransferase
MNDLSKPPIIGCVTYRKTAAQANPVQLFALMPSYVEAVAVAGGAPLLIPLGLDEPTLLAILEQLDGLLLTGGGDIAPEVYGSKRADIVYDVDNDRDRVELFLAREAIAQHKPVLAICRGHQMLNVALGGTLYEDVQETMPGAIKHDFFGEMPRNHQAHDVIISPGTKLADALKRTSIAVNSLHHQGIRDLASGLVPSAYAPDGLIEGVESPGHPFAIGVQWHPENLIHDEPAMLDLFRGLIQAASLIIPTGQVLA